MPREGGAPDTKQPRSGSATWRARRRPELAGPCQLDGVRETRPAHPGEPAVWTLTVTVESTPAERHLEPGEKLERLLEGADGFLRAAGLGRVRNTSVAGPTAVAHE